MSRIRVIHVSVGLNMGGMEKLLVEFARHTDRDRFDLKFVSLTTKGETAEQIEQLGWPVTTLDITPGIKPAVFVRLTRLFRQSQANVVHTHNTKPLIYAIPAAHFAGVQTTIHTRHGQRLGATRRQHFLFNLAASWTDRIVSVSSDSTKLALRQGIPAEKLVTIPNGIDPSLFPAVPTQPKGPVVYVGRLSPEKDLPTLLRAVAIAIVEEPSFRLHLAGSGQSLCELQSLSSQLGLGDHVTFLGHTRDVAATLAGSSLFVLSSLTEGISLALLEAMARGLPVVATAVGGNAEVVIDGKTGLLVPPQSPADLAAAMLRIYRQPELARQMGIDGRKRVETQFDSRTMVSLYESLYLSAQTIKAAA
ncbi:MAG TPA: glycosyltransferase [Tepidisphaeraceae bacterium]|jgi:glycosyltransferase involved in cell wall biosynthesis